LNPKELSAVQSLRQLVADRRARVIGSIRQELLSGIRNADQFEALQHRFRDFEDAAVTTADHEVAAEISPKCRRMGIAASAMDALICALATLRNWEIFSWDKDFERYRRAVRLRLYRPE
jgi:predicted nucleic acid-binding protein